MRLQSSVDVDFRLSFLEIVVVVASPFILHGEDKISYHHGIFADATFVRADRWG